MTDLDTDSIKSLGIIAGRGVYPLLLAESAREQGVEYIFTVAFKGETSRKINHFSDEVVWLNVGKMGAFLEAFEGSGVRNVVMAGQIAPRNLFRVRMDRVARAMLKRISAWNAHTIFGAVIEELQDIGLDVLPATLFMEKHMPSAGCLGSRSASPSEEEDIRLGLEAADMLSALDIGQTVVVKNGMVLAVEAFEGTNATLKRAGKLGGPGATMVKVAKQGHDSRFDIPVVGAETLKVLKKAKVSCLAVQAGRAILLERDRLVKMADRMGLAFVVLDPDAEQFG